MMSLETPASSGASSSAQTGPSATTSPAALRHRPSQKRLSGREDGQPQLSRRRSSHFSEPFSDTHRSFRSSTDDLLLPRVRANDVLPESFETTHWHSIPLALALLPAVGGLLFKNGSAVVTDITLLGLAAIFLNWALRLPWEWYHAAQSSAIAEDAYIPSTFEVIEEEEDEIDPDSEKLGHERPSASHSAFNPVRGNPGPSQERAIQSAGHELRVHEMLALLACFLFPMLGAWFLHTIRSQLTRPSEGLVSNYNLTIFLLVAEIRPLSHLMKMIQRRTLFLQKRIESALTSEQRSDNRAILIDVSQRLEDLEAHVVKMATETPMEPPPQALTETASDTLITMVSTQATSEMRKSIQPELDALNRAMRRYEKRMTISAIQVEARLQDLEARLKDVVVLAAAAQRSVDEHPRNHAIVLVSWLSAMIVIPARFVWKTLGFPIRLLRRLYLRVKDILNRPLGQYGIQDSRAGTKQTHSRSRPTIKRPKGT